jgi:glycosyltransferase involved in cell wall biosynthesis
VYISVIIPTYNRLPILQQCLRALAQQQPGPYDGYEVVVVDDGSTDGTV